MFDRRQSKDPLKSLLDKHLLNRDGLGVSSCLRHSLPWVCVLLFNGLLRKVWMMQVV